MPIEVTMPKLSPTMETGVIAQWLVKVGDQIKEGDVLADIETDKATMPMKSYDDGRSCTSTTPPATRSRWASACWFWRRRGRTRKQVAAALGLAGQAAAASGSRAGAPSSTTAEPTAAGLPAHGRRQPPAAPPATASRHVEPSPEPAAGRVQGRARWHGRSPRPRTSTWAGSAAPGPAAGSSAATSRRSCKASRSQRRACSRPRPPRPCLPHARPTRRAPHRPPSASHTPGCARRSPSGCSEAKQAAPEIHLTVDIRVDRVVAAREELNKQLAAEGIKISLGDFVTKAVALALRLHPGVNASFEPDAIVRHGEVNIGIAVALDGRPDRAGPAPRRQARPPRDPRPERGARRCGPGQHPDRRAAHRRHVHDLATWACSASASSTRSSTCPRSASSPSGPPRSGPVVDGDQLAVGTVMTVTLTADHRAVDGAMAAEFLQTLKGLLEEPARSAAFPRASG